MRIGLGIFALSLFAVGQQPSHVEYPGWTVHPSEPTSDDSVSISVYQEWGSSCVPDTSEVWRDGNDIYFELDDASVPPCPSCAAVVTCCVNLSEIVGQLEPETYTVYAIVDPLCPYSVPRPVLTFTVRPAGPVPSVSTWGLAVMALLELTAGTVVFRRQERAAS